MEMIPKKTVSRDTHSALSFGKKDDFFSEPVPKSGINLITPCLFPFPVLSSAV